MSELETSLFLEGDRFVEAATMANRDYLGTPYNLLTHGKKPKYYDFVSCLMSRSDGSTFIKSDPDYTEYMEPYPGSPETPTTYRFKKLPPPVPDASGYTYVIEKDNQAKIKKVLYRPNHGFNHSMRVSAIVPMIQNFYMRYGSDKNIQSKGIKELSEEDIKRLQLMMLYSVTGREDERGFGDDSRDRKYDYKRYRAQSAEAFFKFCKENRTDLYPDTEEGKQKLYHDALMVEMMGYQNGEPFPDVLAIQRTADGKPFRIIEMMMEDYRNRAPKMDDKAIREKIYQQFPKGVRNTYLDMVNDAHSHDLIRCFTPGAEGGDMYKNLNHFLSKSTVGENSAETSVDAFEEMIRFYQYVQKFLSETGELTTTTVEMDRKIINKIFEEFALKEEELQRRLQAKEFEPKNYKNKLQDEAMNILKKHNFLKPGPYAFNQTAFQFIHYNSDRSDPTQYDSSQKDHQKEASMLCQALDKIPKPSFYQGLKVKASEPKDAAPRALADKDLPASPIPMASDDYILDDIKKLQKEYASKRYAEIGSTSWSLAHKFKTHDIRDVQKEYLDKIIKQAQKIMRQDKSMKGKEKAYWLIKQALEMTEFSMQEYKKSNIFSTKSRLQTVIEEIRSKLPQDTSKFTHEKYKQEALEMAKDVADLLKGKKANVFQEHIQKYSGQTPKKYPSYKPK